MSLHVCGDFIGCNSWNCFSEISVHSNTKFTGPRINIDFRINEGDYLIFAFCNTDCFLSDSEDVENNVRQIVHQYFLSICMTIRPYNKCNIGVSSVLPYHSNYPSQFLIRNTFNKYIEQNCITHGYDYINVYKLYEGPGGYIPTGCCDVTKYILKMPHKLIPVLESIVKKYNLNIDFALDKLLIENNVFGTGNLFLETHLSRLRPDLKQLFADKKNILIIGMNRGHAVNIALMHSSAKVTATTITDLDLISFLEIHFPNTFKERFVLFKGQATKYLNTYAEEIHKNNFDLIYINRVELTEWDTRDKCSDLNSIFNFFRYNGKPLILLDHYSDKHFDSNNIISNRVILSKEYVKQIEVIKTIEYDLYNTMVVCKYSDEKSLIVPVIFQSFLENITQPTLLFGIGSTQEIIRIVSFTHSKVYDFEYDDAALRKMRQDIWSISDYDFINSSVELVEDSHSFDEFCTSNNLSQIGLLYLVRYVDLRKILSHAVKTIHSVKHFAIHFEPSEAIGAVTLPELFCILGRAGLKFVASAEFGISSFPLRYNVPAKLLFSRAG